MSEIHNCIELKETHPPSNSQVFVKVLSGVCSIGVDSSSPCNAVFPLSVISSFLGVSLFNALALLSVRGSFENRIS